MQQKENSQMNENSQTPMKNRSSSSHVFSKLKDLLLSAYVKFVARKAAFYLVVIFFSVSLVFIV
ncbi:MAG: hypothetical protein ACFFCP_19430, partial [Promethearchaeota archaeon]